jgi:hypothetical protein
MQPEQQQQQRRKVGLSVVCAREVFLGWLVAGWLGSCGLLAARVWRSAVGPAGSNLGEGGFGSRGIRGEEQTPFVRRIV